MSGRITGMLRICKERAYGWIRLAGTQLEVGVLALKTITGRAGACFLISRHTWIPDVSGRRRSRMTADGGEERNVSSADFPSAVTVMANSSASNRRLNTLWTAGSSSTTRILFIAARSYRTRRKATRSFFSVADRLSCSIRLKNSTTSSSVRHLPSCR
jgi:hypothetical protein